MTTVLKVANYSEAQILAITSQYEQGVDLETIAKSVGKTVPSVRAKLSALKVYVSKSVKPASEKTPKENKDGLKSKLESLLGCDLLNVEAASKVALLALINAIVQRDNKIQSLIEDMLCDNTQTSDSSLV